MSFAPFFLFDVEVENSYHAQCVCKNALGATDTKRTVRGVRTVTHQNVLACASMQYHKLLTAITDWQPESAVPGRSLRLLECCSWREAYDLNVCALARSLAPLQLLTNVYHSRHVACRGRCTTARARCVQGGRVGGA